MATSKLLGVVDTTWAYIAGIVLVIIGAFAALSGGATWLVNDDQAMEWLASGWFSGVPESNLVFIKRSIGIPMAFLYAQAAQVPWYALSLLATNAVAFYALALLAGNRWLKCAWLVLAVPSFSWMAFRPNFTATAVVAASVGMALGCVVVLGRNRRVTLSLVAAALLVLAYSWRTDALLFAAVVSLPLALFALYQGLRARTVLSLSSVVLVLTGVSGIAAVAVVERSCALEDASECVAWSQYASYNELRGSFHGAPRSGLLEMHIDELGWSEDAYNIFTNFAYADDPAFDADHLELAAELTPVTFGLEGESIQSHVGSQVSKSAIYWRFLAAVALTSLVPAALCRRRILPASAALLATLSAYVVALSLASLIRSPAALVIGGVVATGVSLFAWSVLTWMGPVSGQYLASRYPYSPRRLAQVALVVGAALAGSLIATGEFAAVSLVSNGRAANDKAADFREQLQLLTGSQRLFAAGASVSHVMGEPYSSPRGSMGQGALFSGWPVYSPAWNRRAEGLNLKDVYAQMAAGSRDFKNQLSPWEVLYLGYESDAHWTAKFVSERLPTGQKLLAVRLKNIGDGLAIWRFIPFTPPLAEAEGTPRAGESKQV